MFDNLNIYKQGEELAMPCDIDNRDKYMYLLIARFEELHHAQRFALEESKIFENKWKMYCVAKYEHENLCPYFVYTVYNLQEVLK